MNAPIRRIVLSTIALLLSAIGLLTPGAAPAHDSGDYQAGYERGYRNGYRVGYRESVNGEEYSNHFSGRIRRVQCRLSRRQHAGYDRGYGDARHRGWRYGRGW